MKIIIITIFASFMVLATNSILASDQVLNRTITQIRTYENYAIINYTPEFSSTQNCSTGNNNSGVIRFDSNTKKEMFSAALAAATTKSNKVGFGISGCDTINQNHPIIYRIDVIY